MSTFGPDRHSLAAIAARTVRDARLLLGWSQRELAARAGVSQSSLSRFERGLGDPLSVRDVDRLFHVLGVRADLRAQLPVLVNGALARDAVHAWACGYVGRRLRSAGWEVRHEVEIGADRYRGWVDVMAFREEDRSLLIVEVKGDLPDVGSAQRATTWYGRESWPAARRLGWRPARQVVALLALDSAAVDDVIANHRSLLRTSFPGRAHELAAWIREPGAVPSGPSLALIDPAFRGAAWLRRCRSDGRRSPNHYLTYADAADRLRRRGPSRQ